jgi:hypothetical protein
VDGAEPVATGIDGTDESHGRVRLQDPGMVAADHPEAQHRAAQRFMACHDVD